MSETIYVTSKLAHKLPVSDEIQKAIIERMWKTDLSYHLRDILNFPEINYMDEEKNVVLDAAYIQASANKHNEIRKWMLSDGWRNDSSETQPIWIHLIPQYGDSDVLNVLQGWEIPKIEKKRKGRYAIGKSEVRIPPYKEYPEQVVDCTKIVVSIGEINGGYAVLIIPENEKITPRFKATPVPITGKGILTDHKSLNQLNRDFETFYGNNIPPDIAEGLIKTLRVAEEELGYIPEVKLPELFMPEVKTIPKARRPYEEYYSALTEEIPSGFPGSGTIREKKEYDFMTTVSLLLNMKKMAEDDFTYHLIYAQLAEPENIQNMQRVLYTKMKNTLSIIRSVKPSEIDTKLDKLKKEEIVGNDSIISPLIIEQSHFPPYMDLTLGDDKLLDILDRLGKRGERIIFDEETKEELLEKYMSDDRVGISFINGKIRVGNEEISLIKVANEYVSHFPTISAILDNEKKASEEVQN